MQLDRPITAHFGISAEACKAPQVFLTSPPLGARWRPVSPAAPKHGLLCLLATAIARDVHTCSRVVGKSSRHVGNPQRRARHICGAPSLPAAQPGRQRALQPAQPKAACREGRK